MRTEILSQEKNKVQIKAEIEAGEFQSKVNGTIRQMSNNVTVKGFRKGKIPRNVLEMKFGKQAIYAETLETLIPEIIQEIVNDYELDLIDRPSLDVKTMEEGKDLELEFVFETVPEVELPDLSQIEVEKLKPEVTDEMVDETIDRICQSNSTDVEVTERTTTEPEDLLDIEYSSQIVEDEESEDGEESESTDTLIDLNHEGLDKKIKEALVNRETGEKVQVETVIDSNPEDKSLEGKIARHNIHIKGIKKKEPAELNPEFFKTFSGKDMETEDEFRQYVKDQLFQRMDQENMNNAQATALTKIEELSQVDVPESLVSRQMEELKEADEKNSMEKMKKPMSEVLADSSMSQEDYEKTLKDRAYANVKRFLVMDAIEKQENITVTKEDIDSQIANISQMYGMDPNNVKAALFKEKERIVELENEIKTTKMLKTISDKVQLKEVDKITETEVQEEVPDGTDVSEDTQDTEQDDNPKEK